MKSPMKRELSSIFPQHNEETIISTYDKVIESLGEDSHPYLLPTCIEKLLELPDTKKTNKSSSDGRCPDKESVSLDSASSEDDNFSTPRRSFVLASFRKKRPSNSDDDSTLSAPISKKSKTSQPTAQKSICSNIVKNITRTDKEQACHSEPSEFDPLDECKKRIQDIISDIDDGYLEYLINEQEETHPVEETVNIIVEFLLENSDYPKTASCSKTKSRMDDSNFNGAETLSNSSSVMQYEKQSIALLQNDFSKVPTRAIRNIFDEQKTYTKTRKKIETVLDDINSRKMKVKNTVLKSFLRTKRESIMVENLSSKLANEMEIFEKGKDDEGPSMTSKPMEEGCSGSAEAAESNYIECGCCYTESVFEEMVQCNEGHLFCVACLQNYSKEAVYGSSKLALVCMTQNCGASFPRSQLKRALSADMMEKYMERVQNEDLKLANIKNLVKCPHCEFHAEMDDDLKVFHCQNSSCLKETCRYCQEEWKDHMGLRCNEVEKKEGTSLRTSYEEKMTEAKVRRCLQCSTIFVKFDGCNKMTCRCGAKMCYVCRKDKVDYEHFCQHPRNPGQECTKCKKCCLWTDPSEDDERAIAEIKAQAEKEGAKLSKGKASATISIGPSSSSGAGNKTEDGEKKGGYYEYYGSSEDDDDSDDGGSFDSDSSDEVGSNGSNRSVLSVESDQSSNDSDDSEDSEDEYRYWNCH